MAVGDIVSDISAVNTILGFQPAAGVECVITCFVGSSSNAQIGLDDGTNTSLFSKGTPGVMTFDTTNMKMFITNTDFVEITAVAALSTGFTGIQTV